MGTHSKKVLFSATVDSHILAFHIPFLKYFKEQGYEVHVATNGNVEIPYCDVKHIVSFERSPFKLNNLRAIKQLKKIIDSEQYEIIHTHTPMGGAITRLAAKNARKNGTRVIYTAHGFHFFKGAPILNWLIFYPIEKILARYTDTLITINKEDYELAKNKFKTDVQYVPGVGIDPKKFDFKITKRQKTELRQSLGLKDSDFVIIYPAELNKNKNQLWLINSLAELIRNNPKLHLLLPGNDSLGGKCQELANRLGIENNIHFLGYRSDIPHLLKISDLAISSSLREGLPVNIMEAMYIGLPVIATNCRGNRDLVKNNINGHLIKSNNVFDIVQIIKTFINNETGTIASKYDINNISIYTVDNIMKQMVCIYDKKPRIIHLLCSDKFSGAENVACEIINNTPDKYETFYCSPSGDINNSLNDKNINHINIDKLSYFKLKKIINKYKPEIIHAHDFRSSIIASFFNDRVKIISHIHQKPDWVNSKMDPRKLLYKWRLKHVNKVVVVESEIRLSRVFSSLKNNLLVTLPNTLDKEAIVNKASEKINSSYDIGFCGRLESVKQPLDFIKIVAEIKKHKPNICAFIVGTGSLIHECKILIAKLELENNITIYGFQDNPYKFISSCKFLLITSHDEGFGLVAAEAAILGVAVLSYRLPSIQNILGKEGTSYQSKSELTESFFEYMKSNTKYNRLIISQSRKLKHLIMEPEAEGHKLLRLYQGLGR